MESESYSLQWPQPCRHFKFPEIRLATRNFDESLVIGHGGFGKVYKGTIHDGSSLVVAAIKRLDSKSDQGADEFWAEVKMLSKLRHCHLVSLIGYCDDRNEMILVYEYMPYGSFEDHLHKFSTPLPWLQRLKLCIGAARGLDYLHTGTGIEFGVIHRDVKSANILLNDSWAAKIADFGLSKIGPKDQPFSHVSTLVKGTFGYLDPDYFYTGRLTRKSDVYAFGVVLFEVLCRKRALDASRDEEQHSLARWVQDSIKDGTLKHIIDSDIRDQISPKCLKGFAHVAYRCLHSHPKQRPTMAEVVVSLESVLALQEKNDISLQSGTRTILGRMANMFPFAYNGENSGWVDKNAFGLSSPGCEIAVTVKKPHEESFRGHAGWLGSRAVDCFTEYDEWARYKLHEVIGTGSSGVVCSAFDTLIGEKVAIKKINDIFGQGFVATRILREILLLRLLQHPDIVEIKHILLPPSRREFSDIYVVFELMESDLHHVIKANENLTPEHCRFFLYQLLRGLKYMHSANVFHRDLKPKNILVNADCKLKICDFGIARVVFNDTPTAVCWTDYVATRWYRAPELCGSFFAKYTQAIDTWSIGCIFAELLTGKPLFPGKSVFHQLDLMTNLLGTPSPEAISRIRNEESRKYLTKMRKKKPIPFSRKFPNADPLALRLLERMLAFDPTNRPTAEEALSDPYFKNLGKVEKESFAHPIITKREFEFEKRRLCTEDIRERIYKEILEYHPNMVKNEAQSSGFTYQSAFDKFQKQFSDVEEHYSKGKVGGKVLRRQSLSLPRASILYPKETAQTSISSKNSIKKAAGTQCTISETPIAIPLLQFPQSIQGLDGVDEHLYRGTEQNRGWYRNRAITNRSEEQSNRKQGMAKRRRNSTQPSSSRGNDDANDANWLHNDFENQDYGEDEFIDETPRVDVISDDSGEENIPKRNPKRNLKRKGHAPCWVAFDTQWIREEDGVEKKYAECLFCLKSLKADGTLNGTTELNRHWRSCKANPENQQSDDDKQAKLSFKKDPTGKGHVYTWVHDEVRIAKAVLGIFTIGELPFKWLENEACIELVNALNGRVILPSRHMASRNVAQLYLDEKSKLLKHLSNPNTAVHLTTDTWTSPCQRKNYMVITAHFIDDDWVMHKRVVNFREVDTHKGEDMARELLVCIHKWGMKKVMSMTVDNAKSNDVAIKYLVKKLPSVYDNGNQFHIRCMAHIINLIVKMGLKHQNYHVECVQNAVKYIRGSTQWIKKFKKAMKDVAVDTNRFLCGETPTRWNSTFELLKSAYDVRDTFVEFGMQEKSFEKDVDRVPEFKDFEEIKKTIDFIEKFKTKTEKVSCSTKSLIHQFTREILDIQLHLTNWSTDPGFVEMVPGMKEKYDKYWSDYEKTSDFMLHILRIAVFRSFMEDSITQFRDGVARFCNHLESSSAALLQSVNRRSIPFDSASLSFVQCLNRRVSTATSDLNLLESMSSDTVSFEELLGHCNEVYKKNQNDILELEDRLSAFGYVPEVEIDELEEDCIDSEPNTNLVFKNTMEDDSLFDDTLSLQNLGISDASLATIVSEQGNNKFEMDGLYEPAMDISELEKDEPNELKSFQDSKSLISPPKDVYESLPSYMKSLASWEDLLNAVDKMNLSLETKNRNFFTQDEVPLLELGHKSRSYLLLLVKMNCVVVETIDGLICYKVL
ncbi:hypothetical protein LXL04_032797 [Taraxacum kok-saghyz]